MKGQKSQNLVKEVVNLIIKFFKPYGLKDEILAIPKSVRRMGFKVGIMNFGVTVVALTFAFLLKITNLMIEQRMILLGIICFMLYRGQQVVREGVDLFESSERKKFDLIFEDEIVLKGSKIIGLVADKVFKYDELNNLYKVMSNESVLNTIRNYLQNFWRQKIQHTFDIYEMFSVIVMLVVAVVTNTAIPQSIFIPLISVFVIISFFSSAYISLNREMYYKKHREYNNEQSLILNDLLRVPVIVKDDLDMRINNLQKSVVESNANITQFHKKMNVSRLITTMIETCSQYGIIIFYLIGVEWQTISLATIAEITANLMIVETALWYISRIAETINNHNSRVIIIEKEEKDITLILDMYKKEINKVHKTKIFENIEINPFLIRYLEESDNDRSFTLISENAIHINKGDVIILSGVSGTGKSTFMKMLTERIKLEESTEIPATSRYLFYDEKLKFGSLSIFEELFCSYKNPNLEKMQSILENLHLWIEIKSNCFDIWKWMKQKKFGQTLSNGQNQRLILAKMLYWLDENIDIMVLDECTSGLDEQSETDSADAERILNYIVRFCNQDKKRIVIISTHQNIDGFKQKLKDDGYTVRNLQFKKDGEKNIVKEI